MAVTEDAWDRTLIHELASLIDNDLNNRKELEVSERSHGMGAVQDGSTVRVCVGYRTYAIKIERAS